MSATEPWSYHVDGTPVYTLADIIAEAIRRHSRSRSCTPRPSAGRASPASPPPMGESPHAVVVLRPGAQVSEAELIAWTRDRLAHFKCPAGVTFAGSLALTPSGKLRW
jgi:acyl-CoA synthetase (AMP-forming)/AMP-acid ligase II